MLSYAKAIKNKAECRAEAVKKEARFGRRVTAGRGELLTPFCFLKKDAVRRHCKICDTLREAVGELRSQAAIVFKKKTMRIKVRVNHAVHKAVRDVTSCSQKVQEEMCSKLLADLAIVMPFVAGGREDLLPR